MRKLGLKYFSCPVNCIAGRIMKISQNIALVTSKIAIYFFPFSNFTFDPYFGVTSVYLCIEREYQLVIQHKKGVTQINSSFCI